MTSPPYADSRTKTYGGIEPDPGKWPNRFRDSWERLLQFNKTKNFNIYQESVMVPVGIWAEKRLKKLSETDTRRDNSRVGSGFGKNISNWVGRKMIKATTSSCAARDSGHLSQVMNSYT